MIIVFSMPFMVKLLDTMYNFSLQFFAQGMQLMQDQNLEFLAHILNNIYPTYFYLWVATLSIICIFTFTGHIEKAGDKSASQLITQTVRKKLLVAYLLITAVFFLAMYVIAYQFLGKDIHNANGYMEMLFSKLKGIEIFSFTTILNIIAVLLLPIILVFFNRRYIRPKISSFLRKYRVSQTSDTLSDVRIEQVKNKAKDFEPKKYYKENHVFVGLDEKNEPVYLTDKEFSGTNIKILGATQTGKGVTQGVLLDQSIRKNWGTIFIDQKPDDFIYSIMVNAAAETGRKIIVFDANEFRGNSYEPFLNGNKRDVISRLYKSFSINDGGTDADFYKRKARACINKVMEKNVWDRTLQNLKEIMTGNHPSISDSDNEFIRTYGDPILERASEWLELSSMGYSQSILDIPSIIENGDILYIRGHLKDRTVKAICKNLLTEISQSIINISPKKHCYINVDEIRFLISSEIADSLATILSKNANMGIAYQEKDDLLNIEDESPNVCRSIMKSTETNTNITLVFQSNSETANWVAENSGTIAKSLTKLEEVDTDGFGAENWGGRRMIGQDSEFLITVNTILSLPARVAVLKRIGSLSQLLFTCWISIDKEHELPVCEKEMPIKKVERKNKASNTKNDNNYIDESELLSLKDSLSIDGLLSNEQEQKKPSISSETEQEKNELVVNENTETAPKVKRKVKIITNPFGDDND